MSAVNRYRCDLRDMRFLMFEQFKIQDILNKGPYKDWGEDEVNMILDGVYKWSCEVPGPLNYSGDKEGCKLQDGVVTAPKGFKAAWDSLYENGWRGVGLSEEHGGQGGPDTLAMLAGEMISGSNTAFNMYSGLTTGVFEVIESFGTKEQKDDYLENLVNGKYAGTMCLTESQAGSDVGAATTKATPLGDGKYKISGTKIYISGGQQDLSENIIHLVLARTPGSAEGTKGLSLFIVPRDHVDGSGSNNVVCAYIEHKMGINGSSTAVLNFGEGGDCIGYLVGTEECKGIRQMFKMMNRARIFVGVQGLAVAGAAYLNALAYAKERKQGPSIKEWKNPKAEKVAIINHPNVRRLLLDMKARVEGIRALVTKLAMHLDRIKLATEEKEAAYHQGQVDLLVPLVKSYASDEGFNVTVSAIQVFGGAGYLQDHPVEQYCRDAKIFSIYEGTNHIQALDLVGRKLSQNGGENFRTFLGEINKFVGANKNNDSLGTEMARLGDAANALGATAMRFLGWTQSGKFELVPLTANRFMEMMSQTAVAWLLLEAALIAEEKSKSVADNHPDKAFYTGKIFSAKHFANLELPRVTASADNLAVEDRSALDIPDEGFGGW